MDTLRNVINQYIIPDITEIVMNYYDVKGQKSIRLLCESGNLVALEIIHELIGIDTPLLCLDWGYEYIQIIYFIIQKYPKSYNLESIINIACKKDNVRIIEMVLNQYMDLNQKFLDWTECLYFLCSYSNKLQITKEMLMPIINKGARKNIALEGACRAGDVKLVNYLLVLGAWNLDMGLKGACETGQEHIIKLMIQKGAENCENCNNEHFNPYKSVKKSNYQNRKLNMCRNSTNPFHECTDYCYAKILESDNDLVSDNESDVFVESSSDSDH